MNITELFEEFYYLSDLELAHKYAWLEVFIDDRILVRILESSVKIYFLYSSVELEIPLDLFNIFMSFFRLEGDTIQELKPQTEMEKFLVSGCKLINCIYFKKSSGYGIVDSLIKIGSRSLRDYIKDKYEQEIHPMLLKNIKESTIL